MPRKSGREPCPGEEQEPVKCVVGQFLLESVGVRGGRLHEGVQGANLFVV